MRRKKNPQTLMTKDEEMFVRRKATGCCWVFFNDIFTFVSAKTKLRVQFAEV